MAGSGKGIGAWLRANWFVVALAGAVAFAWLLPAPGAKGGFLHGEITSKAAVAGIFFTQGLVLALEALKQGALQWRLHAYVQAFTFLVFPAAGFALDALLGGSLPDGLRTGLLFLCVLPTTVSTAAVLTGLAGGNLAGALFNVTLSNVLGVFLTPLWVGVLLSRHGGSRPLGAVIGEVCLLLLVPLALGQVTRRWLGAWADQRRKRLGMLTSWLMLFIIYTAFCNSVQSGFWAQAGASLLGWAAVVVVGLFFGMSLLAWELARLAGLRDGDRVAALFCAGQKTLATGVPMGKLIFATSPQLGAILLPLMLFHPLQLFMHGLLAARLGRRAQAGATKGATR